MAGKRVSILIQFVFTIVLLVLLWAVIARGREPSAGGRTTDLLPESFEGIRFSGEEGFDPEGPFFCLEEEEEGTHLRYAYVPAEMSESLHIHMKSSLVLKIEGVGDFRSGDPLPAFKENSPYLFTLTDAGGSQICQAEAAFCYSGGASSLYVLAGKEKMDRVISDKEHETSASADFLVYKKDGTLDCSGRCSIKGRGNSTWSQVKKPFNLNLEQEQPILGMEGCQKYALITNFWDSTQMRQMLAYRASSMLNMPYTAETAYVNFYLNGSFQGLYLLSQRLNVDGGTVKISDLDEENKKANRNVRAQDLKTVPMDADKKNNRAAAFLWPEEPEDISGGYFLEMDNRYKTQISWFETLTRHIVIKSPEKPSKGEYEYISSYIKEAEKALYGEDGIDQDTGRSCFSYFDLDSWARMYLIQDFFIQADDEFYSFYFYKEKKDPFIYCGPVWDFDQCLGTWNYGDYYKTLAQTMWLRDSRKRWLNRMDQLPEFREKVRAIFLEEFEPLIRELMEKEYDQTVDWLEKDADLNKQRWNKTYDFRERTDTVKKLILERTAFYHDYYLNTDQYHRLLFHFEWGDLSYYVRDGKSMGFLPLEEYGECQSSYEIKKHGRILGWKTEEGTALEADTPVYRDIDLTPDLENK